MTTDATQDPADAPRDASPAAHADLAPATHPVRAAEPASPGPMHDAASYQPLDRRALRLWQLTDAVSWTGMLLIGAAVGTVVYFGAPRALPWVAAGWLLLALLGAWTILYFHPRNYRAWGYRLDERVLLIRRGVWFRSIKLLPLPRLQHVDIKRGPLQQKFGLATLTLHTAGTQAASIELPGLDADEALRLRDRLVAAGGDDGV